MLNFKQNSTMSENQKVWKPTEEAKGKATQLRLFAALLWVGAIAAQVAAIIMLRKQGENFMAWVIGLIVVDLILAIIGSMLWKKSNRLDPASEKNGFLFFIINLLTLFEYSSSELYSGISGSNPLQKSSINL